MDKEIARKHVRTEALVLSFSERFPRRMTTVIEQINGRLARPLPRNELERAVDFLMSAKLLEMRTPKNNGSKTLFMKKTERVPADDLEMVRLLMRLHGIARH